MLPCHFDKMVWTGCVKHVCTTCITVVERRYCNYTRIHVLVQLHDSCLLSALTIPCMTHRSFSWRTVHILLRIVHVSWRIVMYHDASSGIMTHRSRIMTYHSRIITDHSRIMAHRSRIMTHRHVSWLIVHVSRITHLHLYYSVLCNSADRESCK